eukprot:GFUD01002824.1.p1 GENE.GFUD01002824.1~~GFUD01002824.1.p1  ORF type:complete len:291 (+),score=76.12 GFUD01002824.1:87-959(+)
MSQHPTVACSPTYPTYSAQRERINLPKKLLNPPGADHVRMPEPSGGTSGIKQQGKSRNVSSVATLLSCNVCRERAGKHSYYGGQVCPSCRAFFRRSVQSGYNTSYVCVKNKDCQMSLKTRKNCQFCRYKLCEEAGMKTAWVLTEEERKLKFEGRGKKKRKSENNNDEDEDNPASGHVCYISEEEMAEVNYYTEMSEYHQISKVHDMDTPLIREIIRLVAFQQNLSTTGQDQLRSVMGERLHKFALRVVEWIPLPGGDVEKIICRNIPILVEMQICTFFNPDLVWREQITS